jgi:hypothetical protein
VAHGVRQALFAKVGCTAERIEGGDPRAVAPAIDFLDADPRCFRSGYAKEHLCHYLARFDLTRSEKQRLGPIVSTALTDPHRPQRERKRWEHLATSLGIDTSGPLDQADSPDPFT